MRRYTLDNVVPTCSSCNASKCNDEVTGWLRRRRLDERTFLLRHLAIGSALQAQFRPEPWDAPDRCPGTTGIAPGQRVLHRRHDDTQRRPESSRWEMAGRCELVGRQWAGSGGHPDADTGPLT